MKAITREEKIMSGENLTPITRKEMFLAKASGMDIETPTPITREEIFLSKIGGTGGGTSGATAYTVSSVDELPSNAVDGSMAIVESDMPESVIGVWRFKDTITVPNATFDVSYRDNGLEGTGYSSMCGDGNCLYHSERADYDFCFYDDSIGWLDEAFKTIYIDPNYDGGNGEFYSWLKANANKLGENEVGYWRLKESPSFEGINFSMVFSSATEDNQKTIYEYLYDEDGGLIYDGTYDTSCAIDEDGWRGNQYKTLKILQTFKSNDLYYWLIENATKITIPLLYTHENGQWVYKCEVI